MLPDQSQPIPAQQLNSSVTQEIQQLLDDTRRLRHTNTNKSITLAQQALALSQDIPDYQTSPYYIEAHIELAHARVEARMYAQALSSILQAKALLENHSRHDYTISVHTLLASMHLFLADYAEALVELDISYAAAVHSANKAAEAEILTELGQAYTWLDDYPRAIEYYHKALAINEHSPISAYHQASLYNNLAFDYLVLNKLEEAAFYGKRGLEIARQNQLILDQVVLLGTLSEIALAHDDQSQAEAYIQESKQISLQSGDERLKLEYLRAQVTISLETGHVDQAIATAEEGLELSKKLDTKTISIELLHELVKLYEHKADVLQALQHARALKELKKLMQREQSNNRLTIQQESYRYEQLRQEHHIRREKTILLEQLAQERQHALDIQQQLLDNIAAIDTPILPLFPGVLAIPLIGVLTDQRMTRMYEQLLLHISEQQAQVALLDITGVSVVDTFVASALIHLVQGAALMGCHVILVGIRPDIAQTLVALQIDLVQITTCSSLDLGLLEALKLIGYSMSTIRKS